MKKIYFAVLGLLWTVCAVAQNFAPGNVVVYRVGDGSAPLSSAATPVFLDEYLPLGGAAVRSLPMPTTMVGSNQPLLASGTATSEGLLNRSTDGRYLVLTGYATTIGTAGIVAATATAIPRVVGLVDYSSNINTTTALTDFASGSNPRSAISTDGTKFWLSGGAGARYALLGATSSQSLNSTISPRDIKIFQNQLYVSVQSGSINIATVGSGLPTTSGQTITNLNGLPTGVDANQFIFFDLDATTPGLDVLYYADEVSGIQKYSLVGASWVANGGVPLSGARGLTGTAVGNAVTLYTTTSSTLYRIIDLGGYNVSPTSVVNIPPLPNVPSAAIFMAAAPTNTAFRGVALAPTQFILPVSLAHISVSKRGATHEVFFTNLTESSITGYAIERSADGRHFTTLSTILPIKNDGSATSYTYRDAQPLPGRNIYRVKAFETTGKVVASRLVSINDAGDAKGLSVYPNPVKGGAVSYQALLPEGSYVIAVRSALGQTIHQRRITHRGGLAASSIDLTGVAPGIYYLEVVGATRYSSSFVIE